VPVALRVQADGIVEITMSRNYGDRQCTADLTPTTSEIDLPASLTTGIALTVQLAGMGDPPITVVAPAT